MARDRQKSGYIWGKGNLDYANPSHYLRALDSDDIRKEEYYYQSVLHGPTHARALMMEVFQKRTRNKVTNKVEVETLISGANSDVVNNIKSEERRNSVMYSRVVEDTKVVDGREATLPDNKVGIGLIIKDIAKRCNPDQIKVLAFFIVTEGIDQLLEDSEGFFANDTPISVAIYEVQSQNITNINSLNKFVGTKYRTENARGSLCSLIRKEFPTLMVSR